MLWVPQVGCAFCKTEAVLGLECPDPAGKAKTFLLPGFLA